MPELLPTLPREKTAHDTNRILATTPKADTTWLKALSYTIVNRNKYALAESPLLTANPHKLVLFFDWDVYANNPTPNLEDIAKPRIFPTHAPYATLPDSIKDSRCRIVCVGILWMNLSLTGIQHQTSDPNP
ncbi:hypothetical protein ACSBR1_013142 [Camellia fascicularis]